MSQKLILTDCDGVLLDWEQTFHAWMASHGYKLHNSGVYEMDVAYGIPRAECKRLVRIFNESAWMGFLPALRDARSGVARLVEAGYTFLCITSLSLDEKARLLRISNLKNIFGKDVFRDVVCLDTGADKDDALEPYKESGMWWLEDKIENAECGHALGLNTILIAHDHNKKSCSEGITRVDNWKQLADTILGE